MVGNVTVPIYPTLTETSAHSILALSVSKLCFVGKCDKAEMKGIIPADLPVVTFPLCPEEAPVKKWRLSSTRVAPQVSPRELCTT